MSGRQRDVAKAQMEGAQRAADLAIAAAAGIASAIAWVNRRGAVVARHVKTAFSDAVHG